MKHLFIVNPAAGGNDQNEITIKKIKGVIEKYSDEYDIYVTEGPMDAAEKVKREAIKGDIIRVYACGGDGTLSECVHGAAGFKNAAVTHYPYGTENDFIKTFQNDATLFYDLEELICGNAMPIDIIDVNGRKCIGIGSVGIDARVGIDSGKYKRLGSKARVAALVSNFFKGINTRLNITVERENSVSGSYALICVCNGGYYCGGLNPVKNAVPNDGKLDIIIVKAVSVFTLLRLKEKYANGEYYEFPEIAEHIIGRRITVEADSEFPVNVDGEALYTKRAEFKLIPNGVNFIFPKNSSFFRERALEHGIIMDEKPPQN